MSDENNSQASQESLSSDTQLRLPEDLLELKLVDNQWFLSVKSLASYFDAIVDATSDETKIQETYNLSIRLVADVHRAALKQLRIP